MTNAAEELKDAGITLYYHTERNHMDFGEINIPNEDSEKAESKLRELGYQIEDSTVLENVETGGTFTRMMFSADPEVQE